MGGDGKRTGSERKAEGREELHFIEAGVGKQVGMWPRVIAGGCT